MNLDKQKGYSKYHGTIIIIIIIIIIISSSSSNSSSSCCCCCCCYISLLASFSRTFNWSSAARVWQQVSFGLQDSSDYSYRS